jgi:putative spermidine/putrescine transport system permease protein
MPLLIYQQAIGLHRWSFAAAISMLFMISVVAIVYLVNHAARGRMRGVDA